MIFKERWITNVPLLCFPGKSSYRQSLGNCIIINFLRDELLIDWVVNVTEIFTLSGKEFFKFSQHLVMINLKSSQNFLRRAFPTANKRSQSPLSFKIIAALRFCPWKLLEISLKAFDIFLSFASFSSSSLYDLSLPLTHFNLQSLVDHLVLTTSSINFTSQLSRKLFFTFKNMTSQEGCYTAAKMILFSLQSVNIKEKTLFRRKSENMKYFSINFPHRFLVFHSIKKRCGGFFNFATFFLWKIED